MPRLGSPYKWDLFVSELRSERYLGITQETLARKLRVSIFSVSKWERGEAVPMPKVRASLKKLAQRAGYSEENWPTVSKQMKVVRRART
jgi:transcriptional regulator with XRE-family HTH domain